MRCSLSLFAAACFLAADALGQEFVPTPSPELSKQGSPMPTPLPLRESQPKPPKRGWFSRMLHPFGSSKRATPVYKDPKLRGLTLELQVSPQTVKLSEVRQLEVNVTL